MSGITRKANPGTAKNLNFGTYPSDNKRPEECRIFQHLGLSRRDDATPAEAHLSEAIDDLQVKSGENYVTNSIAIQRRLARPRPDNKERILGRLHVPAPAQSSYALRMKATKKAQEWKRETEPAFPEKGNSDTTASLGG
jgi:hypothetical protein